MKISRPGSGRFLLASRPPSGFLGLALLLAGAIGGCAERALDGADGGGPSGGTAGAATGPGNGGFASPDAGGDLGAVAGRGSGGGSGSGGTPGSGGVSGSIANYPTTCGSAFLGTDVMNWIVFDSDRENFNRDVFMVRANGTEITRLTTEIGLDREPSFSPDGNQIAFTSDRSGTFQIHVMNLTTRLVTQVTRRPEGADQSSFSHDGAWITFHSGPSVYVIHPDGTAEKRIATGLDNFNAYSWPQFAVGDQELIFDRNNEIDAVRLDGSGFRRIVANWTTTIKSPTVSPTGVDIAYAVYCGTGLSIWTTPFSTTTNPCEGRRLTPVGEPPSQRPAWGPNNVIAYERVDRASNVASIALISRTAGSMSCILTADTADSRNPSWSQ